MAREPSAPGEGKVGQLGEDLPSRQAAVSPLLMMTGRGSQLMRTAERRHRKVSPPLQSTGKWDTWKSKRQEVSRGRERGKIEYDVIWKTANQ